MGDTSCPTVISYFGGKFEVSKRLVPMIPKHEKYIEVFAGGLSMFFRKGKAKENIVNDLNKDIANLYLVLSDPELYIQFIKRAEWLIISREIYDIFSNEITLNYQRFALPDVKRAVTYYYFIMNSFNSMVGTDLSMSATWKEKMISSLRFSRDMLADVIVENNRYEKLISKHYKTKKETFWYLDPPYVVADTEKYYAFNFINNDHARLKKEVDKICSNPKSKVMISYDDIPMIRELYKDYVIKEIVFRYSSNNVNKTELLIMNYTTEEQGDLF